MLSLTETKALNQLFSDLTEAYTKRQLSTILRLPYAQVHRSIGWLVKKGLITQKSKGKSILVELNLKETYPEYVYAELERKRDLVARYSLLRLLDKDLKNLNYNQYICLVFGSYAEKTAKKESDIDILFVIPDDYDFNKFDKAAKNVMTISQTHIQVTTEKGLIEMWNTPHKFNVGNELLKKHVILYGAEQFLNLRRRYYVG
ncbi:MAG: nucleotidyltransferase domain-containing protein [Candidatus Woesearchaeota archaeon]